MLFSTSSLLVSLAVAASVAEASKCSKGSTHRRHHNKHRKSSHVGSVSHSAASTSTSTTTSSHAAATTAATVALAANFKAVASSSASKTASSSAAASASASSSSSSTSTGWGLSGLVKNGIYVGMLPDDGSGGGTSQTITTLNTALGGKAAAQGWYAQAQSGTTFTGSQLTSRMDQIKVGGVFQPAVMPTGGWEGLTSSDNSQAVAICKVMKEFTDEGIEVWLRFGHEVNYYQTDGTYEGDADDFKEGWATVAAACQDLRDAGLLKMFFTPNIASLSVYEEYFPDDVSTVDIIGVDYYPHSNTPDADAFLTAMQGFHDKYCSDDLIFAIGEIGLGVSATIAQRLAWFEQITSAATAKAMPYFKAVSWFNYYKDAYDYRIAGTTGDSIVKSYLA